MTSIRLLKTAETSAPDDWGSSQSGAPAELVDDALPAIDASPLFMRAAHRRRAIPDFDSESDERIDFVDLVTQAEEARGSGRARPDIWPDIRPALPQRAAEPAPAQIDPWRELATRCSEITDLQKIKERQAAALARARDTLTQQEQDAAAAKQALQQAEHDKAALRAQLEKTSANFAELLQKTTELKAAFNQREQDIAAMRSDVASLKTELSAKAAGDAELTAAIEHAGARYRTDFDRHSAEFEAQIERLARTVGARNERIRTLEEQNARIAARCDALAKKVVALDAEKRDVQARFESEAADAALANVALRTEREAAEQRIAGLIGDLERERVERAADAHETAMVCKEIVELLPRLAQQPRRAVESFERAARSAAGPAQS